MVWEDGGGNPASYPIGDSYGFMETIHRIDVQVKKESGVLGTLSSAPGNWREYRFLKLFGDNKVDRS